MTKPKILMFPSVKERYIKEPMPSEGCLKGLQDAGAEVKLVEYTWDEDELLCALFASDGLFLQGGDDVDPARYGEALHPKAELSSPIREAYEMYAVRQAVKRDMPVFAICRGSQCLNVALGGSLYQDVPEMLGVLHSQSGCEVDFWHDVAIRENSIAFSVAQTSVLHTNSYHHQAVKALGKGLVVTAMAGKVVEAIEMPGKRFVLGLQWHPEVTLGKDDVSQKFFDAFVHACRQ